jgi:fructokinase
MHKLLCIGEALIDMICTDKGQPLSAGENFLKKAGGAPTNVAAAIAALGGRVDLAAKVGADPFGQHLVDVMESFGVGTRFLLRDHRHFTTLAFVSLMHNGERDFYFNRGADGELTIAEVGGIELAEYGMVHFGSATAFLPGPLQGAYLHLLHKARAHNLFVSFDPNYRQLLFGHQQPEFVARCWQFLNQCHFFKVSDEEALLITGKPTVEDAAVHFLQHTTATFAITLGAEGTLLGLQGATHLIPSIPVKPVDTTGAGDAFVGALLYQLSNLPTCNREAATPAQWQAMVANANKAGARTCEYLGAMEAFRHLSSKLMDA